MVNSKAVRQTKLHLTLRAPVLCLPPLLCNITLVPVVAQTAVTLSMKIVWHAPCCQAIMIRGGHDPGDLLLGMSQHLGKILEKVVHSKITKFWDENKFLTKNQGGFRKGFSTVSTMADLTDDLFTNINLENMTLAASIDLRKAFDTVNLSILKKKLERAGICHSLLLWCESYLTGIKQCT